MVELTVVSSGAVMGQRAPPPRLLARLLFSMDESQLETASHLKGGDCQVTPLPIHGCYPHISGIYTHQTVPTRFAHSPYSSNNLMNLSVWMFPCARFVFLSYRTTTVA